MTQQITSNNSTHNLVNIHRINNKIALTLDSTTIKGSHWLYAVTTSINIDLPVSIER